MNDPLAELSRHADLTVTIGSGTEHFRAGRITLSVRGDGAATVEQKSAGVLTRFEAKLTPLRVDAFGRTLDAHHLAAPRTSKLPREPGDTPLLLSMTSGTAIVFHADLWTADRYDDADLNAIFVEYDQMVYEVTGGKLGHPRG